MALTMDQREVFMLAMEVLDTHNIKAMNHEGYTSAIPRRRPGYSPIVDWAINYIGCLPDDVRLASLVIMAHIGSDVKWTRDDITACGGACRGFYRKVRRKRLFGIGMMYFERSLK